MSWVSQQIGTSAVGSVSGVSIFTLVMVFATLQSCVHGDLTVVFVILVTVLTSRVHANVHQALLPRTASQVRHFIYIILLLKLSTNNRLFGPNTLLAIKSSGCVDQ